MAPSQETVRGGDSAGGRVRGMRPPPGNEVVISGISGLFPSSDSTQQFMENLFNKVDMVTPVDLNFDHPELPNYMGKINGTHEFDAQFFRVTYYQALSVDPMGRKLLEHAYSAMFDAGVNPMEYKGKKVGVYIGSSYSDASNISLYHTGEKNVGLILSGTSKSMFANRISFWLDGKGPSYTLDCTCSSSLMCLEHARDAILSGACDAAIVGGCNICIQPKLMLNLSKAGVLCLDGKTKCFDQSGDGYVRSEAITVLFLQRAKDAKRIYAEVYDMQVSYGLTNDTKFLTMRDSENIVNFLEDFYSRVDISPSEVEYVEAHGAAIADADANELKAIDEVFCKENKVLVGCVKSNMGNSEPASGACALTKLCLAYHRGALPANLHYSKSQAVPTARDDRVRVLDEQTPFRRGFTALNNFSYTGTNAHVLLKGHFKPKDTERYKTAIPRLVLASGRQEECVESLLDTLKSQPIDLEQIGLLHSIFEIDTVGHMCRGYSILDTDERGQTVSLAQSVEFQSGATRPLWLVYSGMGSQWPAMGRELMKLPVFAAAIERCHKAMVPKKVDLVQILTDPDESIFENILHSFVGIAAVQIGLTDVLKALDIVPDNIIGHSMGEMGCGYFEGCITTEEMILSAYYRGLVSLEVPLIRGTMAAIGLGYKDILPLCPPEIDVACHNSAESTTIAGPEEDVQRFISELTERGVFARKVASSNIAYHSRYVADVGPPLLTYLNEVIRDPKPRTSRWISTSIPQAEWDQPLAKYCSGAYHVNNSTNPVLFEEASQMIPSNAVLVEVAPHGLMQAILKRSHPECINIPLTRRLNPDPVKFLLEAIGKLYKEGVNPKVSALYPKIEFPVSTETPLLSHLVKWEHSEHWPAAIHKPQAKMQSSTRKFVISLYDDEYMYITGHVRNGVIVIPETTLLCLIWETLAMYRGVEYHNLSVTFNDVHFLTEAIVSSEEPLRLTLTINKGNHIFEICHQNTVLANGSIAVELNPTPFQVFETSSSDKEDELLESSDIYQLLQLRGFGYKDEFHSIYSANLKGSKALVKWTGNWATFLDSLIQLNILAQEHDGISTPKIIKQLTINMFEQNQRSANTIDGDSYYKAWLNKTCGVIRCAGVEIKHVIFNDIPSKELKPDILETISFMPHIIREEVNMENVLQVQLQIVADNVASDSIKVTCTSATRGIMKQVSEQMPTIEFQIYDDDQLLVHTDVLVVHDLLQDQTNIKKIHQHMGKDMFILTLEKQKAVKQESLRNKLLTVVSMATVVNQTAVLLKKAKSEENDIYITIKRDDTFLWVTRLLSELPSMKRVVLVSEHNPHCGLFGLVKKLRNKYKNKIGLVATYDCQAPSFNPEKPFYKEQLQKNLTFNIFKKGEWGSYYRIPVDPHTSIYTHLISTKHGEFDAVRWVPAPRVPTNGSTDLKVCFAGPSMRDALKAVGTIEAKNGFGMDFSGIGAKGTRVMGIVPSGALASQVPAENALLWPVPAHWSLQEAATVPLLYALATYCLVLQTQLRPGQRLLVTDGAGALGQACIALALRVGAKVFVTISDNYKKRILLRLFPDLTESNIGYSGRGGFSSEFYSKDKRCDIVVNCYSGVLREGAMKCVKAFGIFLDLSEYDMLSNKNFGMAFLEEEKSYKAIQFDNIFRVENSEERKVLRQVVSDGVAQGWVRPLTRVHLPADEAARALRLVASSGLAGRVLLRLPTELSPAVPALIQYGTTLLVGAEGLLAAALAKWLVKRGTGRLLLQTRSTPKHRAFWKKLGVSIATTSENLETEASCLRFLREGEELGPIREIYVVQEYSWTHEDGFQRENFVRNLNKTTSVVKTLDQLSRNNCPELSKFVIITYSSRNAADEYAASVSEKICEIRTEAGLPALALRIEGLEQLTDQLVDQQLNWHSALHITLEAGLSLQHTHLIATKLNTSTSTAPYLHKIAEILGIDNIDDIDENVTLGDVVASEVNLELIRAVIKDRYKIDYTVDVLRRASIASLKRISENCAVSDVKNATGLDAFYSFVDHDIYAASESIVSMHSLLSSIEEGEEELDAKETYLMLIPGFEGHHHIFKTLSERLKVRAVTLQLGPDLTHHTVREMAARAKRVIQKRFEKKSKFYLLGYSFGVNVALELAAMLEKEGLVGLVYCLDSSPDALRAQLDVYMGELSDTQMQCAVLLHMHRLMAGRPDALSHEKLDQLQNWTDRVQLFVSTLKQSASYSSQYARTVVESAYSRLKMARSYEPDFKLESDVVLIKGATSLDSVRASLGNDYNLSKYTKRAVRVFDLPTEHVEVPRDCRLPNIVNSLLDPQLLDLYRKTNLCECYLTDS